MAEANQAAVPELLGLLLGQTNEHALILLDADAAIIGWFAGSERIFGYHADEVLGHKPDFLFTPEDRERGIPQLEVEIASKNGQAEDDRWQLRKDGGRFWASGTMAPLRAPDGRILGFGKILRNRTDQRAQVESLEKRVEALARQSAQHRNFIGMLAHELRNPLSSLIGSTELLQMQTTDNPELGFAVKLIRRQAEFIQRLVEDLLDVTRLSIGKVELHKSLIDLNQFLENVAESFAAPMKERQLDFHLLLPAATIRLQGDNSRLRQVLSNLLDNAMKYTEPGCNVWLKATVEGNEAAIRVEDTGIGIAADVLPQIFELFTQEESARSRSAGGLGIGLALVKDFVALHGGTVTVRSDGKNRGSEFTVRLPLPPEEQSTITGEPVSPT